MTFAGVLAQSSNIGTIQAAEMIGKESNTSTSRSLVWARVWALGSHQRTAVRYHRWKSGATLTFPNVAYGQGYSANAIQMTSVFSTIANKGVRVTPRIIDSKIDPDGTVERPLRAQRPGWSAKRPRRSSCRCLNRLCWERGTAQDVAAIKGYRVAGRPEPPAVQPEGQWRQGRLPGYRRLVHRARTGR